MTSQAKQESSPALAAPTPGPWRIIERKYEWGPSDSPHYSTQYAVYAQDKQVTGCDWNITSEANARLIASAPELLAALREALQLIQEDIDNRDGRDSFGMVCGRCQGAIPIEHSFGCRAHAAIRKAEGK